eukprot:sb/3469005/
MFFASYHFILTYLTYLETLRPAGGQIQSGFGSADVKTPRFENRKTKVVNNRHEELVSGVMANIRRAPEKLAEDSVHVLSSKTDHEILVELENVVKYAEECTYANQFYQKGGLDYLLDIIKRTPVYNQMNCSNLSYSLQALYQVMDFIGSDVWESIIDNNLIKKMVEIIRSPQASGTPQLGSTTTATGRTGGRTSTVSTLTRNSSIRDSEYNNRTLDKGRRGQNDPLGQFEPCAARLSPSYC